MFRVTTIPSKVDEIKKTKTGEIDFSDDFFGKPAYLTVSGQLSGEAYAWGYGDLYQLGRGKDDSSDAFAPEKIKATKKMEGKRVAALSFGGQHAALVAVEDAAAHHAAKRARE